MSNKIQLSAKSKLEQINKVAEFGPGDTVVVQVKVKEGDRERLQAFEGVVIAKQKPWLLLFHREDFLWGRCGTNFPNLQPVGGQCHSEASWEMFVRLSCTTCVI